MNEKLAAVTILAILSIIPNIVIGQNSSQSIMKRFSVKIGLMETDLDGQYYLKNSFLRHGREGYQCYVVNVSTAVAHSTQIDFIYSFTSTRTYYNRIEDSTQGSFISSNLAIFEKNNVGFGVTQNVFGKLNLSSGVLFLHRAQNIPEVIDGVPTERDYDFAIQPRLFCAVSYAIELNSKVEIPVQLNWFLPPIMPHPSEHWFTSTGFGFGMSFGL